MTCNVAVGADRRRSTGMEVWKSCIPATEPPGGRKREFWDLHAELLRRMGITLLMSSSHWIIGYPPGGADEHRTTSARGRPVRRRNECWPKRRLRSCSRRPGGWCGDGQKDLGGGFVISSCSLRVLESPRMRSKAVYERALEEDGRAW